MKPKGPEKYSVDINLNDRGFEETYLNDSSRPYKNFGYASVMPVKIRLASSKGAYWELPIEPFVSVSGGNVIAKRTVAKGKGRGTIKEYWTQDDYSITIDGLFIYHDDESRYPQEDVKRLIAICEAKEVIDIECPMLSNLKIDHMVIEKFDFPFTKGENSQRYTITGFSDDLTNLLEEIVLKPTTPETATFD
ncbi:MAG: DUF6046 domain-containing protein [Bacteroidota bacterium]